MRELTDAELQSLFQELMQKWHDETGHFSSTTVMCSHPSYQQIIGLGPRVVPLILLEMSERSSHWFWALNALTRQDAAKGETTVEGARQKWLEWGRKSGMIPSIQENKKVTIIFSDGENSGVEVKETK